MPPSLARRVARIVREILGELGVTGWPKTSGGIGDLHQGIDDSAWSLDTLPEWAERDGLD